MEEVTLSEWLPDYIMLQWKDTVGHVEEQTLAHSL